MAAVISARPAMPHPKMKRPPHPLQTSMNGAKSSQSSPSPSLSSKRPPSGFKQPSNVIATNGVNGVINGPASRSSVRRKDLQKPADISTRQHRSAKGGLGDGNHIDKKIFKRMPGPFVRTAKYILTKFQNKPPSLILHLHPTHFRFDQQDGSFAYNSPMRVLLEHVKTQTIPHDMLDELYQSGIKFYEGCLTVQVQDHRNTSIISQASPNTVNRDKNVPFSIHNYNEHLTPSPYIPYPHSTASDVKSKKSEPSKVENDEIVAGTEKEKNLTLEQQNASTSKNNSKGPKITYTVLFPTPMSLQEDILLYASTPDVRSNNRKQSQNIGRTPTSATLPQPPTPLSAVPPTPSFPGPPAKRQKMMLSGSDIPAFEGKVVAAMAAPLYLDPVSNLQDTQRILRTLQDPLFQNKPPAPKTRKRTVAELAADEALAAEEQRFMLIMDERLVPSANTAAGNTAAADGESGAASFEPRFERFKALEEIKLNHQEKARRDQEVKSMQQATAKAKQELQEREARQMHDIKVREAQRQEQMRQFQMKRDHALQQQQMAAATNQHSHPQTSNGIMTNAQQLAVSQAHHSSPVVRNLTPHNNNSSPLVGNVMIGHSGQSMPMTMSTSSQGAGSPARPGSALQHAHPAVTSTMNHQRSQQQPPSRNGTPQMPNGTPRLPQANTPVTRHVTPTPRMSHASPANSAIASSTPVMGHSMMATPHINGQQLTPQQQQAIIQRQQQAAFANQQHAMQNSPPNSQHNLQAIAAHQAHQANQARNLNLAQQDQYRRQLHSLTTQHEQMRASQNPNAPLTSNMALLQQQQHQQQQHAAQAAAALQQHNPSQQSPQQALHNQTIQSMIQKVATHTVYPRLLQNAQAAHGQHLRPEILQHIKSQAVLQAKAIVAANPEKVRQGMAQLQGQAQSQFQAQQQRQQQQQQQHAMMNGGMNIGGMGGMGMSGMNGMNGIQ